MDKDNFLNDYLIETPENESKITPIGNVSLFSDDSDENQDNLDNLENHNPSEKSEGELTDIISVLLKDKGISDPTNIKVVNENDEEEFVDFKSLTIDEQLEILKMQEDTSDDLDDAEIDVINYLRKNQLSFEDVINYAKHQGVQEYLSDQTSQMAIDQMSDDEIFLADIAIKIPNITESEAEEMLEFEKQNEKIFSRKIEAIRSDLVQREKQRVKLEQELAEQDKQSSFEEFKRSLTDVAPTVKDIGGRIELEDSDLNETIEFLLAEDSTGTRFIAKALNDPASLLKMAWFYVKGEESINYLAEYYENQIKEHSQSNYQKGYEDGKLGKQSKQVKVVKKNNEGNTNTYFGIPENPAFKKTN